MEGHEYGVHDNPNLIPSPLHGVQKTNAQTSSLLLAEENTRRDDVTRRVAQEKKVR